MKSRILSLVEALLSKSEINKNFHPVIMNLVKGFLEKTDDDEIKKSVIELRDKIIPWILHDENKSTQ